MNEKGQTADRLNRLERGLQARLASKCPAPHALGEYHLGLLPPSGRRSVGDHLAHCPHCQEELRLLSQFLADDEPSPLAQLTESVMQWAMGLGVGGYGNAVPGVRGDGGRCRIFHAGPLSLTITVQQREDGLRDVLGLVVMDDGVPMGDGRVWVQSDQRRCLEGEIDQKGNFAIVGLMPGEYDLGIECQESRIWVRGVTL